MVPVAYILRQATDQGLSLKASDTDTENRWNDTLNDGALVTILGGLPWPGLTVLGIEEHVTVWLSGFISSS